jgi:hypothetical protein
MIKENNSSQWLSYYEACFDGSRKVGTSDDILYCNYKNGCLYCYIKIVLINLKIQKL